MTERNPTDIDECQYVSYHSPHWDENGKCHWNDIQFQKNHLMRKRSAYCRQARLFRSFFYLA